VQSDSCVMQSRLDCFNVFFKKKQSIETIQNVSVFGNLVRPILMPFGVFLATSPILSAGWSIEKMSTTECNKQCVSSKLGGHKVVKCNVTTFKSSSLSSIIKFSVLLFKR